MPIDWEPLRQILENHQTFILTSHVRPDADALGSELGMAAILEAMGKTVNIVNPSASPHNLLFLDPDKRVKKIGTDFPSSKVLEADVHIILDTSAWGQLGPVADILKKTKAIKVVIDHHVSSDDLGAIEFKDTKAAAAGELVCRMAERLGYAIPPIAATPLYCAMATDTGWFRFPSTSNRTMKAAGHLIEIGAKPHELYETLYENCSHARILLAGKVLSRVKVECDGQIAYSTVSQEDFKQTGANSVDTEDLVNDSLKIAGTKAAFIAIEQQGRKNVKISLRSRLGFNVATIAEQFGGGGHQQASGAMIAGSLEEAAQKVLNKLTERLQS